MQRRLARSISGPQRACITHGSADHCPRCEVRDDRRQALIALKTGSVSARSQVERDRGLHGKIAERRGNSACHGFPQDPNGPYVFVAPHRFRSTGISSCATFAFCCHQDGRAYGSAWHFFSRLQLNRRNVILIPGVSSDILIAHASYSVLSELNVNWEHLSMENQRFRKEWYSIKFSSRTNRQIEMPGKRNEFSRHSFRSLSIYTSSFHTDAFMQRKAFYSQLALVFQVFNRCIYSLAHISDVHIHACTLKSRQQRSLYRERSKRQLILKPTARRGAARPPFRGKWK